MKWLFKPKKVVVMGVGSHTIKIGEFTSKGKKSNPVLDNFALLEVPNNCIKYGDILEVDPISEALSDFIATNTKAPVSDISVAMGGRSVIIKKLEILMAEKALMDDLVQEEVSQSLPFSLEEVNYDYIPMSSIDTVAEGKTSILLMAAKKESVYGIEQVFNNINYKCRSIDMEVFAIAECVKFVDPEVTELDNTTLVLDIGKCGTTFVVLKKGEVVFSRYLTVGGDSHTTNLVNDMKIGYEEAESLKISWRDGKEAPPEVRSSIQDSNRYFCDEISSGIEYFRYQFPNEEFSKIYVTGGGSKLESLNAALSETFGLPTEVLNPLKSLEVSDFLQDSLDHIKYFSPAIVGLFFRSKGSL